MAGTTVPATAVTGRTRTAQSAGTPGRHVTPRTPRAEGGTAGPAPVESWPQVLAVGMSRGLLALLACLLLWATAPMLLGWHASVVMSGSMRPAVRPGDVLLDRALSAEELVRGQVVVVHDPDHPGRLRAHRLVRRTPAGMLVLQGDANPAPDTSTVAPEDVRGVGVLRVPWVGLPVSWVRRQQWLPVAGTAIGLAVLCWLAAGDAGQKRRHRRGGGGSGPGGRDTLAGRDTSAGRVRRGLSRLLARTVPALAAVALAVSPGARATFTATTTNPPASFTASTAFDP